MLNISTAAVGKAVAKAYSILKGHIMNEVSSENRDLDGILILEWI
jgi:hypothetical protein